jgi:hypothetical protein
MAKHNKKGLARHFFNMLLFAMLFLGPIFLSLGLISYFLLYNANYSMQLIIVSIILAIGLLGYFINSILKEGVQV